MGLDTWTKRGAVVGGIWGLLAYPILMLVTIYGPSIPDLVRLLYPPIFLLSWLPYSLIGNVITLPSTLRFMIAFNFLGWVLIGGAVGYLYGLIKGDKR